jgi:hypothetical protein
MNNRQLFRRMLYIGGIALLLIPLYRLGQPLVKQQGGQGSGGELARMRDKYDIGQADIGQIDPASESMRLATLGMRGVAAGWLWQKAEYYKEEKYYDRFAATLNQIALLQPHFVKVWESQAHNLSYNVSHEFDDYRQRYAWVKKGIDYLIKGTKYNERQPILQWHLGWYMNHKLGRSDERKQFRQLFRDDNEFHEHLISEGLTNLRSEAMGADRKPDNWLAGRLWFLKAYDLVQSGALIRKSEVHFYAEESWSRMYYAEALQSEGILDDRARFAWSQAADSWRAFGNKDIRTSWGDMVRLRNIEQQEANLAKLSAEFDELTKDVQAAMIEKSKADLTEDEKTLLSLPEQGLLPEQIVAKQQILFNLKPSRYVVARNCPNEIRDQALTLATSVEAENEAVEHTKQYRELANYRYWEMRSEVEQTPVCLAARRQVYEGDKKIGEADLLGATKQYEKAWLNWNAVFRSFPDMMLEDVATEVTTSVNRYLSATDAQLTPDMPLFEFMQFRSLMQTSTGIRVDIRDQDFFMRCMRDAKRWQPVMDQPALLDNDHIPKPADEPAKETTTSAESQAENVASPVVTVSEEVAKATTEAKPSVESTDVASEVSDTPPTLQQPEL